jgi:hypothetical protein
MNRDPEHQDLTELPLVDAALGHLSPEQRQPVRDQLAANDVARKEVDTIEATAAALAFAAPVVAKPAVDGVRARLLARAAADAAAHNTAVSGSAAAAHNTQASGAAVAASTVSVPEAAAQAAPPTLTLSSTKPAVAPRSSTQRPAPRNAAAWWVAGLASLAAAACLVLVLRAQTEREALRSMVATLESSRASDQARLDSLAVALSEREQQLLSVTGPDVAVVELASTASLPPAGRMFWDRASARWTFVANNLPQLESGRTYQLWLVTANAKISAGTFTPDASGIAVVRATYELPRSALAAVAVTEEAEGGAPQPTGAILLVGSTTSADTR